MRSFILGIKEGTEPDLNVTRDRLNSGQRRKHHVLSIILAIIILGILGITGYVIARMNVSDKFTEFYALGINGQASDYPTDFTIEQGRVVSVEYGRLSTVLMEQWGRLTLVIVNHEGQSTTYTMIMQIDGAQVGISFQGNIVNNIGPITLKQGEKWDEEIGIQPQHTGDDQEVEILLYKGGGAEPYLNLSLWINVN